MQLFHLSRVDSTEGVWYPRCPDGSLSSHSKYKEPELPRICAAPTIRHCIWGTWLNYRRYFTDPRFTSMIFTVYTPKIVDQRVAYPYTLAQENVVHDALITLEHGILDPVFMKAIGRVRIFAPEKIEQIKYHPFGKEDTEDEVELPTEIAYEFIN